MRVFGGIVLFTVVAGMLAPPAQAVPITFSTDASFLTAAGGGLAFESFETAVAAGTTVTFPGGTFSCSGSTFCPGFFGVSTIFSDTGSQSIFYATPDTATLTISSPTPLTAFGIAIGGAGDVAPIHLTATLSSGATVTVLGPGHTGPFSVFGADRQYFGVIDTVPFTSITFTADNSGDGIFLDSMSLGMAAAAVPELSTLLLLGMGLAAARVRRCRRRN